MRAFAATIFLGVVTLLVLTASADEAADTVTEGAISSIRENFTEEERKEMSVSAESFSFQAEVSRLMDIIINSLYTQKEVFLRELISNAADALEKARFLAISEPGYLGDVQELDVRIEIDPEAKTVTIQDTGIGMTRDDLINNLGTVARSGTTNFLEAIAESGDVNLIGQFGVGFYSAFLVADRVTVTSKNNQDPDQHIWESMIGGSFTVVKDPRGNTLGRGTRITLHLKDDSTQFLEEKKVKDTVLRFNQFVNFPIKLRTRHDVPTEAPSAAPPKEEEENMEDLDEEPKEDSEAPQTETSTAPPAPIVEYSWEILNNQKPIWMRPKENITENEYFEFYRAIARDSPPAAYSHFSAEGEIEFKALLYVPSHAPGDTWMSYFAAKQESLKLYARRVLVADSVYELLPKWLSFVKGVVDSDDLPLKVDRESFSQSRVFQVISKKVVGKFLDLLKKLSKDDVEAWDAYYAQVNSTSAGATPPLPPKDTPYQKVWDAFGGHLRIGCVEDDIHREKIVKSLRFTSTYHGKNGTTTLDAYLARAPESQKSIFYITNEDYDAAMNSPYSQFYRAKEIEFLVLTAPLTEECLSRLGTYGGKKLVSIEKGSQALDDEDEEQQLYRKRVKKVFEPLVKAWTTHLTRVIGGVRISHTLVDDPAVVSAAAHGQSAYADRVSRGQAFASPESSYTYTWIHRRLDLNPNHPLIKRMLQIAKENPEDPQLRETARTVHDAAMLAAGFVLDDPTSLARKTFRLIQQDLSIPETEVVETYQLTPEDMELAEAKPPPTEGEPEVDLETRDHVDDIIEQSFKQAKLKTRLEELKEQGEMDTDETAESTPVDGTTPSPQLDEFFKTLKDEL